MSCVEYSILMNRKELKDSVRYVEDSTFIPASSAIILISKYDCYDFIILIILIKLFSIILITLFSKFDKIDTETENEIVFTPSEMTEATETASLNL